MRRSLLVLLAVSMLVLSACGGTDDGAAGGAAVPSPTATMDHGMGMDDGLSGDGTPEDCREVEEGEVALVAEGLVFDTDCIEAHADEPFVIAFENLDGAPHNVKIEDAQGGVAFDGENVTADSIDYSVPALAAGQYTFHCHVHPDMKGVVVVD